MSTAREIALSAAAIAKAAAEMEALHEEALKMDDERSKLQRHREAYEAALPILGEWFPGVEWNWNPEGSYGNDTILTDRSDSYPWLFRLRVLLYNDEVEIEVGKYRNDSSMEGYSYFSGSKVKGPSDVGRYIMAKEARACPGD